MSASTEERRTWLAEEEERLKEQIREASPDKRGTLRAELRSVQELHKQARRASTGRVGARYADRYGHHADAGRTGSTSRPSDKYDGNGRP